MPRLLIRLFLHILCQYRVYLMCWRAGKGLEEHIHDLVMHALQHMALHRARLSRSVVKVKAALGLDIVVAPIAQRVVGADNDLCGAAGELRGRVLVFVVLLERGPEFALHVVVADDRLDCLGDVGELWGGLDGRGEAAWWGEYLAGRCALHKGGQGRYSRHGCTCVNSRR